MAPQLAGATGEGGDPLGIPPGSIPGRGGTGSARARTDQSAQRSVDTKGHPILMKGCCISWRVWAIDSEMIFLACGGTLRSPYIPDPGSPVTV